MALSTASDAPVIDVNDPRRVVRRLAQSAQRIPVDPLRATGQHGRRCATGQPRAHRHICHGRPPVRWCAQAVQYGWPVSVFAAATGMGSSNFDDYNYLLKRVKEAVPDMIIQVGGSISFAPHTADAKAKWLDYDTRHMLTEPRPSCKNTTKGAVASVLPTQACSMRRALFFRYSPREMSVNSGAIIALGQTARAA